MMWVLYIIILLVNLISAILNTRSKSLTWLSILFLYLMMWGNSYNGDYLAYKAIYEGFVRYPLEPGFKFLLDLFYGVGFSYQSFLLLLGLVSFLLVGSTVKKYVGNLSLIIAVYLMGPVAMDVVVVRSTFAMAIVIFALQFLIQGKRLKYGILVVVASFIHVSALVFMLPLLLRIKIRNVISIRLLVLIVLLVLGLMPVLGGPVIRLTFDWINAMGIRNIGAYRPAYNNGYGSLLYFVLWVCNIVSVLHAKKRFRITRNGNERGEEIATLIDTLIILNIATAIFVPLSGFNSNYYRFLKNMVLPNIIACSAALWPNCDSMDRTKDSTCSSRNLKVNKSVLFLIVCSIPWFVSEISDLTFSFPLLKDLLTNNIILR